MRKYQRKIRKGMTIEHETIFDLESLTADSLLSSDDFMRIILAVAHYSDNLANDPDAEPDELDLSSRLARRKYESLCDQVYNNDSRYRNTCTKNAENRSQADGKLSSWGDDRHTTVAPPQDERSTTVGRVSTNKIKSNQIKSNQKETESNESSSSSNETESESERKQADDDDDDDLNTIKRYAHEKVGLTKIPTSDEIKQIKAQNKGVIIKAIDQASMHTKSVSSWGYLLRCIDSVKDRRVIAQNYDQRNYADSDLKQLRQAQIDDVLNNDD